MIESYRVINNTRGPISLSLYKHVDIEKLKEVAEHHRRKSMRSVIVNITIPNGISVDLVEKYGFSIYELENNLELYKMVRSNKLTVLKEESKDQNQDLKESKDQNQDLKESKDQDQNLKELKKLETKSKKIKLKKK